MAAGVALLLLAGCGDPAGPEAADPVPRFPEVGTLYSYDTYKLNSAGEQIPGIVDLQHYRVLETGESMFGRDGVIVSVGEPQYSTLFSSIDSSGNHSRFFQDFGLQFGPVGGPYWASYPLNDREEIVETLFDSTCVKLSGAVRRFLVRRSVRNVGEEMKEVSKEPVKTQRFDERLTMTVFDEGEPTFVQIRSWDLWYSPRIHNFVQIDYTFSAGQPSNPFVHNASRQVMVRYYGPSLVR